MAENDNQEESSEKAPGGKKKWLIIGAAAILLVVIIIVAVWFLMGTKQASSASDMGQEAVQAKRRRLNLRKWVMRSMSGCLDPLYLLYRVTREIERCKLMCN